MKTLRRLPELAVALAVAVLPACRPVPVLDGNPQACVEDFDPRVDYFPDKVELVHAEGFKVTYFNHYKEVTVYSGEDGSRQLTYVLVQCGTPRPQRTDDALFVDVPVRTVVTTSTVELPHLAALGVSDRLVGHSTLNLVNTPEIRRRIERGEIADVGNMSIAGGKYSTFDADKVAALAPDLFLAPSFIPKFVPRQGDLATRLADAGVATVENSSSLESTPLGRAEWLAFTALFFNREARVDPVLRPVAERYHELAAMARSATRRPAVLSGGTFNGSWWMPRSESYLARMIADAGGDYLWNDTMGGGQVTLPLEDVLPRAQRADVWINATAWTSLPEIAAEDERLAALPVVRAGNVYQIDARLSVSPDDEGVGNDYWETGISHPDMLLSDLIKIFHPDLLPEHRLTFYRRLDDAEPPVRAYAHP